MDTHRNPADGNGGASEDDHAATLINSEDTSPSAIVQAAALCSLPRRRSRRLRRQHERDAAAPNARTERELVAKLLEAHPDKSDRQIAATAKTDQEAVR